MNPEAPRFRLDEVCEGVHAAIVNPGEGAMGNAAIVDLGDRTLVFDTFLTPTAGRQLRDAAIRLTGRAPSLVVNSHRHADHTLGNQVFWPEAVIVATAETRERMRVSPILEQVPGIVESIGRGIPDEPSEAGRRAMATDLADYRCLAAELADVRIVPPDVTFEERLELHGSCRRAVLVTHGGGHTSSDAFLHLPEERVVLMGDLLFVDSHPAFVHGDCDQFRRILAEVRALEPERLVPGHGPVGTRDDLEDEDAYLAYVAELGRSVLDGERTRDEALAAPLPDRFAHWLQPNVLAWNLGRLLDRPAGG